MIRSQKIFLSLFLLIGYAGIAQQYETRLLRGLKNETIRQWETIEIGIRAPNEERAYRNFLSDHKTGKNPYAAHHIRMQFICNGKTYTAQAFYMEDALADELANKYIAYQAEWPWRIRFAVPDTGNWQCNLLIGEEETTAVPMACPVRFRCIKGNNHGYLQAAKNQTRFAYSDGTPFFVLGQDIAWADEPVLRGHPSRYPAYTAGYYDILHFMDNLAANGGNYVRIDMINWSTGIEWDETGVYNQQNNAWALDTMMRLAEARGLKVHLVVIPSFGLARPGGANEINPWRRDFMKENMTPPDLLRDSAFIRAAKQYLRYVYARWAFSPNVATIELIDEISLWPGHEKQHENFIDFFNNMRAFLKNEMHDGGHMISTSMGKHGPIREWYSSMPVDFLDCHLYANEWNMNQQRFAFFQKRFMQKTSKPYLFGEMGIINGAVNACDPDDWDYCNDITMHNSLWATTFMGGAGAGVYWWQWKNDAYREANYKPIRYFIDSIAQGMFQYTEPKMYIGNGLEVFYCQASSSNGNTVGWLHNTSYWYGNMTDSCVDRDGKKMMPAKDDDKATKPEDRSGNTFTISGLEQGKNYMVYFYDTRKPEKAPLMQNLTTNRLGRLRIKMPKGAGDFAFSVKRGFLAVNTSW
jgi:Domain of unknown function (DUF5060)